MHDIVDLRSDTVTRPTPAMRRAMAEAVVGDDVFADDPTVQRLEQVAAARLRKEAALFVPSGTMGNNVAINVHTRPGDEVLLDSSAHSMGYEAGAPAAISGVVLRQYRSRRGVPDVEEITGAIHPQSLHAPGTALLVVENTHNAAGGAVVPLQVHRALYALANERRVRVHIDGARIFNAAVASGTPAAEYAAQADSISFCLSKGLGCPVGSLLCGSAEFIGRARRVRKMLGGGMRQVGLLAACGLVALEAMIDRLAEDHANARRLAEGIAGLKGITVDPEGVQTNMVYFDTSGPAVELVAFLEARGVRCLATGAHRIRMVTHCDVDADDMETAIRAVQEGQGRPGAA